MSDETNCPPGFRYLGRSSREMEFGRSLWLRIGGEGEPRQLIAPEWPRWSAGDYEVFEPIDPGPRAGSDDRIDEQLVSGRPIESKEAAARRWAGTYDSDRGGPGEQSPAPQTVVDPGVIASSLPLAESIPRQQVGGRSATFARAQFQAMEAGADPAAPGERLTALEEALSSGAPVHVQGVSLHDIREALAAPLEAIRREIGRLRDAVSASHGEVVRLGRELAEARANQRTPIELTVKTETHAAKPAHRKATRSRKRKVTRKK